MTRRFSLVALLAVVVAGCGVGHGVRHLAGVTVHTFTADNTNVHVVAQGRSLVMIDSGYERGAAALDAAMRSEGLDPAELRAIVVTHGHADHAGGARYFQQRYGARLVAGRDDQGMLSTGRNERLGPTGLIARLRVGTDSAAIYTPTTADLAVQSPTSLTPFTGIDGQVVPLPGHTPGSLVVVVGVHVEAFGADDVLENEVIPVAKPGGGLRNPPLRDRAARCAGRRGVASLNRRGMSGALHPLGATMLPANSQHAP